MSVVAVGLRPSVHAADVLTPMRKDKAPAVSGYRLRIVDGNHLPASEKRLKPLCSFRGAALPGQSLVVYDPDLDMVVDLVPCEDGHAQERTLMERAQSQAQPPGNLWMADRNFSTRRILYGLHDRGSSFIVREHGITPNPQALEQPRYGGRIETGTVYEQAVDIEDDAGQRLRLRRVELQLDQATEEGDTTIRLLTNLPVAQFTPRRIARLYRQRWQIESLFLRLDSVLHSEVAAMRHPRAALLAFGVAVLAYNALAVLQSAVWSAHELHTSDIELSSYYFAGEIRTHYAGMMMAVAPAAWDRHDRLTSAQLAQELLHMTRYANPKALRKHPRSTRSETKKGFINGSFRDE
jgi:IS4 transposase